MDIQDVLAGGQVCAEKASGLSRSQRSNTSRSGACTHQRRTQLAAGRAGEPIEGLDGPVRLQRLMQMLNLMRPGRPISLNEIGRKLGISRRTVYRDLIALEAMGVPCRYDAERGGYRVSDWYFLPPTRLTLPEALGLYVAVARIASPRNFPLFAEARRAVEKIALTLNPGLRTVCVRMADHVEVRWPAMVDSRAASQVFQTLQRAAAESRQVRLRLDSHSNGPQATMVVHPYVLALLDRAWYLVGYCREHEQIWQYNLDHILAADLLAAGFERPADFSLEAYLGQAWSHLPEGRIRRVRLRFRPSVADAVEEIVWHKSQRTQRLADGSLLFEVDVDGLGEISRWILGYGDQVVVEKPAELREQVRRTARGILDSYTKTAKAGVSAGS